MITKVQVRPYRGTDQWEADVFMLASGKEVRRRWRSPMPSKLATERWAREKAKGFLADQYTTAMPDEDKEEEKPAETVPLFRDYAVRWMNEYVIANQHSPATVRGRQQCIDADLVPLLGDLPIDKIEATHYAKLRKERTKMAGSSVNKICDQLTTMLNVAVEWKLIKAAPKVKRIKVEEKEMPVLTAEEGETLVETAAEFGAKFHLAALLGVDGGLRNGEIIGLRWTDIDFRRNELVVQNRIWNGQEGPPKGKKVRRIPMTRRLREALEAFPRVIRHVFVSYKGTFIQTNQTLKEWFEPIWEKAQIPRGIHTMRHTFATDALDAGVSLRTVQKFMGHLSIATTEKYLHSRQAQDASAIESLERSRDQRAWRKSGEGYATR